MPTTRVTTWPVPGWQNWNALGVLAGELTRRGRLTYADARRLVAGRTVGLQWPG